MSSQVRPASDGPLLGLCMLLAVGIAAFVALVPLQGIPHVSDEVSYTLQARLFASGMRVGPEPPVDGLLFYPFWVTEGGGRSPFPPGWPALLAVGEGVGLGWLVNPALFGLMPLVSYLLGLRWTGDRAIARLAALVVTLSPGAWILAGSRMSQTSVLVALGLAAVVCTLPQGGLAVGGRLGRLGGPEASPRTGLLLAQVGGLAVAYVILARQYDAALVGGPLMLLGLWQAGSWGSRAALLWPSAAATGLLLADNAALTGSPLHFPMSEFFASWPSSAGRPGCNSLGFGEAVGCHPTLGSWGHTPAKALQFTRASLRRLDAALLGVPALGALAVAMGAWRLRRRVWPALLLGVIVVGGYALYWSPGAAFGARFYHPLYLVLPILVAAGLAPLLKRRAPAIVAVLMLAGGSRFLPDLANGYWCVDNGLAWALEAEGIDEGVVFMRLDGGRPVAWPSLLVDSMECSGLLEAAEGFVLNDPSRLQGGLQIRHYVFNEADRALYLERDHPGASAWLADYDGVRGVWSLSPLD